jgi:hypothetical protein
MKTLIILAGSLFAMNANAEIFYAQNTQVSSALQLEIEQAVVQTCWYDPQWRIFESSVEVVADEMRVVFTVEAMDNDGMHPYHRTMVAVANNGSLISLACR